MDVKTAPPNKMNTVLRYVTGGCLANIPFWMLLLLATYDVTNTSSWTPLAYVFIFVGTAVAGFLNPQENKRFIRSGLATAFSSYIVYVFSVTVLFGNLFLLPTGAMGDLPLLSDFALGGISGSVMKKKYILSKAS